jgi:hypothetical protein
VNSTSQTDVRRYQQPLETKGQIASSFAIEGEIQVLIRALQQSGAPTAKMVNSILLKMVTLAETQSASATTVIQTGLRQIVAKVGVEGLKSGLLKLSAAAGRRVIPIALGMEFGKLLGQNTDFKAWGITWNPNGYLQLNGKPLFGGGTTNAPPIPVTQPKAPTITLPKPPVIAVPSNVYVPYFTPAQSNANIKMLDAKALLHGAQSKVADKIVALDDMRQRFESLNQTYVEFVSSGYSSQTVAKVRAERDALFRKINLANKDLVASVAALNGVQNKFFAAMKSLLAAAPKLRETLVQYSNEANAFIRDFVNVSMAELSKFINWARDLVNAPTYIAPTPVKTQATPTPYVPVPETRVIPTDTPYVPPVQSTSEFSPEQVIMATTYGNNITRSKALDGTVTVLTTKAKDQVKLIDGLLLGFDRQLATYKQLGLVDTGALLGVLKRITNELGTPGAKATTVLAGALNSLSAINAERNKIIKVMQTLLDGLPAGTPTEPMQRVVKQVQVLVTQLDQLKADLERIVTALDSARTKLADLNTQNTGKNTVKTADGSTITFSLNAPKGTTRKLDVWLSTDGRVSLYPQNAANGNWYPFVLAMNTGGRPNSQGVPKVQVEVFHFYPQPNGEPPKEPKGKWAKLLAFIQKTGPVATLLGSAAGILASVSFYFQGKDQTQLMKEQHAAGIAVQNRTQDFKADLNPWPMPINLKDRVAAGDALLSMYRHYTGEGAKMLTNNAVADNTKAGDKGFLTFYNKEVAKIETRLASLLQNLKTPGLTEAKQDELLKAMAAVIATFPLPQFSVATDNPLYKDRLDRPNAILNAIKGTLVLTMQTDLGVILPKIGVGSVSAPSPSPQVGKAAVRSPVGQDGKVDINQLASPNAIKVLAGLGEALKPTGKTERPVAVAPLQGSTPGSATAPAAVTGSNPESVALTKAVAQFSKDLNTAGFNPSQLKIGTNRSLSGASFTLEMFLPRARQGDPKAVAMALELAAKVKAVIIKNTGANNGLGLPAANGLTTSLNVVVASLERAKFIGDARGDMKKVGLPDPKALTFNSTNFQKLEIKLTAFIRADQMNDANAVKAAHEKVGQLMAALTQKVALLKLSNPGLHDELNLGLMKSLAAHSSNLAGRYGQLIGLPSSSVPVPNTTPTPMPTPIGVSR